MNKSEWAAWAQAFGSIFAIFVAIAIPFCERKAKQRQESKEVEDASEITLRFHSEILDTNESMLGVALEHLPNGKYGRSLSEVREKQVKLSISALRALHFDQIRIIASHDPELAKYLADFHCELEILKGILDRNQETAFEQLTNSIQQRISNLIEISKQIKIRT